MNNRGLPGKLTLAAIGGCLLLAASPLLVRATEARAQGRGQLGEAPATGQKPKFEVASVKPCEPGDLGAAGRGGAPEWSPGRLTIPCEPVRILIGWAYIKYADGQSLPDGSMAELAGDLSALNAPIEGLPSWGMSERFTISGEVPGDASKEMMMGPMMQSLLEDRFQLKIRVESRDVPAYQLRVAKGGPKLPEPDGSVCRKPDPEHPGQLLGPANLPRCTFLLKSTTMAQMASALRGPIGVDRPVTDKTGLTGTFSIHMLYAPSPDGLAATDAGLPTIFEALKDQLGLELVSAKGTDHVLVVDHVEEPTQN